MWKDVKRKDTERCQERLGGTHTHQQAHCLCRRRTVMWRLTRIQFHLRSKPHYWALSLFDVLFSFFLVCERFVRTRIIAALLSYLIVDLMVTLQKQNMHNYDSSMFCQVQRRVVRAAVRHWETVILRDVLFMSFETHFHLNRLVQGFRCWRVSEMQMCRGESEL